MNYITNAFFFLVGSSSSIATVIENSMADPNSSDKGQGRPTVEKSYSAGRSFLKDGEETTLMFFWHNLAVDFFVEQGNVSIEVERPVWLIDWPMTSKSLMQNIVNILFQATLVKLSKQASFRFG